MAFFPVLQLSTAAMLGQIPVHREIENSDS